MPKGDSVYTGGPIVTQAQLQCICTKARHPMGASVIASACATPFAGPASGHQNCLVVT